MRLALTGGLLVIHVELLLKCPVHTAHTLSFAVSLITSCQVTILKWTSYKFKRFLDLHLVVWYLPYIIFICILCFIYRNIWSTQPWCEKSIFPFFMDYSSLGAPWKRLVLKYIEKYIHWLYSGCSWASAPGLVLFLSYWCFLWGGSLLRFGLDSVLS